jgi:adenine-specific DNA-methyltransferase
MTDSTAFVSVSHNDANARIFNMDAVAHLKQLSDGSVDLLVTSPPYCIGKEYESATSTTDFAQELSRSFDDVYRTVREGGSICWQIGSHVTDNAVVPLDYLIYREAQKYLDLHLRNRIVWTFGHGIHSNRRLSGRYETILWFTKGNEYYFDLDPIRETQKYPGKRHYKGPKKGEFSGNPKGKNPGDVWDIPNVKANHVEKTGHPCQFPLALVKRLIESMCPPGGLVCDPYCGSGTSAVAALIANRNFTGSELEPRYLQIAKQRLEDLKSGSIKYREDKPVMKPDLRSSVAQLPSHFDIGLLNG